MSKKFIYLFSVLIMPYIISIITLHTLYLRFIIPMFFIGFILYLYNRYKISLKIFITIYIFLIFSLATDTITILFQGKPFDLRFYELLSFDTLITAFKQFPIYSAIIVICIVFLIYFTRYIIIELLGKKNSGSKLTNFVLFFLLLILPSSLSFFINKLFIFNQYRSNLKENISLQKIELNATKGKNLLLIYLESYEQEFIEKNNFPNLAPFLHNLSKQSISFKSNYMIDGTNFTIAGIFASQCGAPFQYRDSNNLVCLSQILHKANYKQVFMQAADLNFENKNKFLTKLQYDKLYGKKLLKPKDNHKPNSWGIQDSDLFEYAYSKIYKLNKKYIKDNQNYNLTLLTIDTHDGVASDICPKYKGLFEENHFFQAYHCTDYLLSKFIPKVLSLPKSEDLVIAVLGDHLQNFDMYASKLNKMDRRVFVSIFNKDINHTEIVHTTTHIDFAPTLLSVLGVKTNAKFLFAKNALKLPKKEGKLINFKNSNNIWLTRLNSKTWLETIIQPKYRIKDLYSYGANTKGITKEGIMKYFIPDLNSFDNYSKEKAKIYYSTLDNMLFVKSSKPFSKIKIDLETKNRRYFNGVIDINRAIKLDNGWFVWVFGNHFKGVNYLNADIYEIDKDKLFYKPKKIIISDNGALNNSLYSMEFNFKALDPKPYEKVKLVLNYSNKNNAKFYISDLYAKTDYPNRIKYRVVYNNKNVFIGDIGDSNGIKKSLIDIKLRQDNKNITVILEAQANIEQGWAWGSAGKIKIDFIGE